MPSVALEALDSITVTASSITSSVGTRFEL